MKQFSFFLLTVLACTFLFSCKKEGFISSPDARLRISADTLKFDTLFTSTGSVTQSFKIVNENDQALRLSQVQLMGGPASYYNININGVPATQLSNIDIAANDSIYVFATVTIDPSSANLPFIVQDSISVSYNGNQRWVQLQAFGQNARFLQDVVIDNNTTFDAQLPYVILGALTVMPNIILTIEAGTRIYAHANAPILVYGSLVSNGTAAAPVLFTGDRLDEPYKNFPAAWPGIFIWPGSNDNLMRFTHIKNAYQAVVVNGPSATANPKLSMQQCIIENAYDAGLLCSNTSVQAQNLLISNCSNNIFLQQGGNYSFIHCTAASYSSNYLLHKTPVLSAANFDVATGALVTNLQASFTNCIFWGDNGFVDNEITVARQGSSSFAVNFTNCLYKAAQDPAEASFTASQKNLDPVFDSIDVVNRYYDFHFNNTGFSPALNNAATSAVTLDLDGHPRPVGIADIGCYEKQ